MVSFKLESTECGSNLLYVRLTEVKTTEVEAHMATYSFFLLQIIDGRLPTGSTNFDNDGG